MRGCGGLTDEGRGQASALADYLATHDRVKADALLASTLPRASWNSFHGRVQSMLERVAKEYAGQTVVAVCHAGVVMASLRVLLGMPRSGVHSGLHPVNTGLTEWEHDDTTRLWTRHSLNETPHLVAPRDSRDGGTARCVSCSPVRPAHSRRMVARWNSSHCSRLVRPSQMRSGVTRSTVGRTFAHPRGRRPAATG